MKNLITNTYKMTYELVPPGCHCRNAAEVAISNFKSRFLSILPGVADNFPVKLWDKLLPSAEITINLLRQSNATPTVSAYTHLNGPFDYNKMPLAPMGCRVQAPQPRPRTSPTSKLCSTSHTADGVPRVRAISNPPSLPRVLPTKDTASSQVMRSMTNQLNQPPTTPVTIPMPRPTTKPKQRKLTQSAAIPDSAPACNTRSHTTAKAKLLAAPATNTRAKRISCIPKPIPILSTRMKRVDKKVHRALAVMDQDTVWTPGKRRRRQSKGHQHHTLHPQTGYPKDRLKDITYGQFVCTIRPEKKEPYRTRLVVGGDRINYPGEVATPTADMLAAKILFNSVISTAAARFMTMDISNFYLNTPLQRPKYIRMKVTDIPEEIINKYKLRDLVEPDNCVYIIIILCMYGLPHAGLIANKLLEKQLNKHGYHQSKLVSGLWKHKWRPIWFTLVVDDFGVKYVGKEHALHLKSVLESYYPLSTNWTGYRYIGVRLDWNYCNRKVHLSMPGYKAKALKQFQHKTPIERQHSPFPTKHIKYGAKKQYTTPPSTAPLLDKKGKKFIQQVCGKLLFLGRAVNSPLLCPISASASQSAAPTQDTMTQTLQLLNYLATQEEAVITYHASEMVLAAHSDVSYLRPAVKQGATSFFPPMQTYHQIMVPSSILPTSSNT
eukprot:CCRYP_000266-RA/>CCRYP_000266-RA protein AED:0.28 eAED:0.30 QI:0/0/0/1/1/1/3/0/662